MSLQRLLFYSCVLTMLIARSANCAQPWLLSFPSISHDKHRVCFSNEQWTAYYSIDDKAMYTVPTDSVSLPPRNVHTGTVVIGESFFSYEGSEILEYRTPLPLQTHVLPEISSAAAQPLIEGWKTEPESPGEINELIGPMGISGNTIWFGLTAGNSQGQVSGGIGWFDPVTAQFGRIYSSSLVSEKPVWIDAIRDTIVAMFESLDDRSLRLAAYAPASGTLDELDWKAAGIPGERILNVDRWSNFLLLATDQAVAIWAPDHQPNVWTTAAWAARKPVRLQMLKFADGAPIKSSMVDFLPMRQNRPSYVMAQIGDWAQIVAPAGIEGFISPRMWQQYGARWRNLDWGCDEPCFARIRVPTRDTYIEGELYNVPLTYIEETDEGVKVGFAAGWVNISDLTPALIPYP